MADIKKFAELDTKRRIMEYIYKILLPHDNTDFWNEGITSYLGGIMLYVQQSEMSVKNGKTVLSVMRMLEKGDKQYQKEMKECKEAWEVFSYYANRAPITKRNIVRYTEVYFTDELAHNLK